MPLVWYVVVQVEHGRGDVLPPRGFPSLPVGEPQGAQGSNLVQVRDIVDVVVDAVGLVSLAYQQEAVTPVATY